MFFAVANAGHLEPATCTSDYVQVTFHYFQIQKNKLIVQNISSNRFGWLKSVILMANELVPWVFC